MLDKKRRQRGSAKRRKAIGRTASEAQEAQVGEGFQDTITLDELFEMLKECVLHRKTARGKTQ